MPRILLAVDLSYQSYRAASSHPNLTNAEGVFTGGLYGFLVSLAATIRETFATRVVICQDLRPYRRSLEYPEYKLLRKKTQDADLKKRADLSMEQIVAACRVIGLPILGVPGFESDDVIAHLVHTQRGRFDRIYAASNDSDLYQLLGHRRFRVYRKNLEDVVSLETLWRDTGLTPEQFMLASALQGTHNDIAGIPRVGPKTAIQAVKDPGTLRTFRERHNAVIERNLRLITLPHPDFPRDLALPPMGEFRHRDLYKFCAQYDIEVTSNMLNSFEQVGAP